MGRNETIKEIETMGLSQIVDESYDEAFGEVLSFGICLVREIVRIPEERENKYVELNYNLSNI